MRLEQTDEVVKNVRAILGKRIIEIKSPRKRRVFVRVEKSSFREALKQLIDELKIMHLSTITGIDLGQEIELLYHVSYKGSTEVTIGFKMPKDNPVAHTITDLIPGAVLYEREVHEVLGVDFEGHPNLQPLILPEKWPHGVYPLRKERKFEELREMISKN
jgi:membrane-bound hydrogenase subunit beta